jgi:hypothetical protein
MELKMESKMIWESEKEKSRKPDEAASADQEKKNIPDNINLTKEQIQAKLAEYEKKYPDDLLQPLILKGVAPGKNRVYILRAITMSDMQKVEDAMRTVEEEEIREARESGKREWFALQRKEGKNFKSEEDLPKDELEKLELFVENWVEQNANNIGKRVNEIVVNMMGVVFPENHSKKVLERKVPYGDLVLIASSIQVHSGWSDIETNVEAYDEKELEELYP